MILWILTLFLAIATAAEVDVWHAYRGDEAAAIERAAKTWGDANGVTVKTVAIPFGAFDSKIETAVPRGNGPDLFIAGHASVGKWDAMGVVVEVDSGQLEGHRAVTRKALEIDGRYLGLPLAYKSIMLLYDPEQITEVPKTTDALIAAAKEHTGNGHYGLAFQASEAYFHGAWMHGFGAEAMGPDGVHLDSPEQIAAFDFARRIARDEGIAPKQPTAELITRLYSEGRAAFVISGPWFVAEMDRPIAAALLPIISETGKPAQPYLTVDAIFLADQAENPRDARAFMAWLAGPDGAQIRQDIGGQAVSWASVTSDDPLLMVLAAQAENAIPMPTDPDIQNVFEAQARALREILRGAATSETAAAGAQTYYEILSRPPPPPVPVWPYLVLMVVVGVGLLVRILAPLREATFRATLFKHRWDYIWIAPAGIAMSVLVFVPFLTGASVSLFAHYRGEWTFVGFHHFLDIVLSRDWSITSPLSFFYTMAVTVLWTATNVCLHVGIGVGMALILREPWIRLRGIWRALLIIPWAVPNYITALIWKGMFHAQYGAINALIGVAAMRDGPVEIDWFGSFATSFCANLITNTWLGFPFMLVVTLGALQSIPRELEEAAEVDGAGWWFRFRFVVWPLLKPALLPAIILGSVWTFNMFNVIYLVSAGEPNSSTEILISEAYRWAFSRGNRYGYAAAYAVLIFFVLLAYSRGANKVVGRKVL